MWLHNKKISMIKAFTVQELLVTMVISSLIMGMVYVIYVQIHKQLYTFSEYGQQQMDYNQFKTVLASDIFYAKNIERYGESGLKLCFGKEEYQYLFLRNMVVRDRQGEAMDTFNIKTTSFEFEEKEDYRTLRLGAQIQGEPLTIFEAKEIEVADDINQMYCNEY